MEQLEHKLWIWSMKSVRISSGWWVKFMERILLCTSSVEIQPLEPVNTENMIYSRMCFKRKKKICWPPWGNLKDLQRSVKPGGKKIKLRFFFKFSKCFQSSIFFFLLVLRVYSPKEVDISTKIIWCAAKHSYPGVCVIKSSQSKAIVRSPPSRHHSAIKEIV